MDYKGLAERLRTESLYKDKATLEIMDMCMDAAEALTTLQAELEKVKAERDAAVADVNAIIGDVEEIRRGYGVDNADADDAFVGLCESYCANYGHGCYKEGSNGYYCANFKWRSPQKEE